MFSHALFYTVGSRKIRILKKVTTLIKKVNCLINIKIIEVFKVNNKQIEVQKSVLN